MKKITFFSTFKRTLFCVIILTSLLSTNKVSSQDLLDRNGNGVVEESDYWNTSKSYSDEYLANYNAILLNRSLVYARTLGNGNSNTRNVNPVGTCNLITCGSFNKVDATPDPDWGGFRIGVDGSTYAANVAYSCWNDNGTVDYSEGQYISYSNADANIETPGIIEQSPDGDGFAIFSFRNESIDQTLTVLPNANHTVCFEIGLIPRYSNDDGSFVEFQPNLQFGISSGGIQISDPLTYTHSDLNVHPLGDFPPELSTATSGNGGFQNPGGWTEIDPFWETVCITFLSDNSGSVNVFYQTGDPGRSVVVVDGLRLSLEGYAVPPSLDPPLPFCDVVTVDLDSYVTSVGPPNSILTWSTNSDPLVLSDHLSNTNVSVPGTFYAFYYNDVDNCASPAVELVLELTDLDSEITSHTNVSCFEGDNGSIDLSVSGGNPSYSYVWSTSNGSGLNVNAQDQSGLSAGTYDVVVTDQSGCMVTESVTITQPQSGLAISADITDVSCFGFTNGAIDITVTGGTSPYTYLWNTGATSEDISGLAAGTYEVMVTDANDCKKTESFEI
ncbi:MAG: SprB repeat-containing protein, partial [Flavobacteriaceae bacterium]|nr:SprB repeat-containing protein [Flavobacteriaceae bacterium]